MADIMFSAYTDCAEFQKVPALIGKYTKIGQVIDYGVRNYVIDVNSVMQEEYLQYLKTLELAGFAKHSDNGEQGLEGFVYTATYVKDSLVVTVIYLAELDKVCISATFHQPLSEHLKYQRASKEVGNAKTRIHMPQLNSAGNSFIIQLKNGHFVIHDGGMRIDAPYLLDYLEELAPAGEKPIVEGWFISHAHDDHYGAMLWISNHAEALERICVEGFYFHCPGVYTTMWNGDLFVETVMATTPKFKTSDGRTTPCYRPQIGQKYYFCDVEIAICLTPELFSEDGYRYNSDINDTSIWLMHTIEGQKFLLAGDAAHTSCYAAMSIYKKTYFDMDIFAALHHGVNSYDYFTDYIQMDTVLFPSFRLGSIYKDETITSARVKQNEHLMEKAKESLSYEEGTVILEFPYITGSAAIVETFDWRYNEGGKRMLIDYDNL